MQITAFDKALEHLGLYRPVGQPGRIDFIAVSSNTLATFRIGPVPRSARLAVETPG